MLRFKFGISFSSSDGISDETISPTYSTNGLRRPHSLVVNDVQQPDNDMGPLLLMNLLYLSKQHFQLLVETCPSVMEVYITQK